MATATHRGDADYEQRRLDAAWNALVPDRYPDAIHAPATRAEVSRLVTDASAQGQRLAIKSGGHNWLAGFLQDGGVLFDLGGLTQLELDVESRLARIEPGVTGRALSEAIVPHGLAFPTGHCPSVGLGGYLLAGGFGWNIGFWGPACWNVEAVDVVTAEGESLTASATTHSELFWAAQGGGSGFPAIATRFHLILRELPAIVRRDVFVAGGALADLMEWTARRMQALAPGTEMALIVRRSLDVNDRELRITVAVTTFGPTRAEAERLAEEALVALPLANAVEDSGPVEIALDELEGSGWQSGQRYAADTGWITDDLDEVAGRVEQAVREAPSVLTRVVLTFHDMPEQTREAALSPLGTNSVNLYACWSDPAEDGANIGWVRRSMAELKPWVAGHYVGESDLYAEAGRARKSFTAESWARLDRVAAEYDPASRIQRFLGADC